MFLLSFRFRKVTFHVGDSSLSERDVLDITAVKISRFMKEDLSCLRNSVRDELISVVDKWLRILRVD